MEKWYVVSTPLVLKITVKNMILRWWFSAFIISVAHFLLQEDLGCRWAAAASTRNRAQERACIIHTSSFWIPERPRLKEISNGVTQSFKYWEFIYCPRFLQLSDRYVLKKNSKVLISFIHHSLQDNLLGKLFFSLSRKLTVLKYRYLVNRKIIRNGGQ